MFSLLRAFGLAIAGGTGLAIYGANKNEADGALTDLKEQWQADPSTALTTTASNIGSGAMSLINAPIEAGEKLRETYDSLTNPQDAINKALKSTTQEGGSGIFNLLAGVAPWALGGKALGLTGFLGDSLQSGAPGTALTLLVVASAAAWIYQNYGDEIKSMIGMDGDDASPNNGGATSTATDTNELTLTGVEPSPM